MKPDTLTMPRARLKSYLYLYIGARPIAQVTAPELLATLRKSESRASTRRRIARGRFAGRIFQYAIATGRGERDIAADLKDALAPVKSKNFAAITDAVKVGELMRAIHGYVGQPVTALALKFAPLVFVRPGELP